MINDVRKEFEDLPGGFIWRIYMFVKIGMFYKKDDWRLEGKENEACIEK